MHNFNNLVQSSSVHFSHCHVWLCNPMDCSTPGFPVHHQLPEHYTDSLGLSVKEENLLVLELRPERQASGSACTPMSLQGYSQGK